MHCCVYRSTRRPDTYVFVAEEADLEAIPADVRGYLGRLELALELELTPERRLAQADARTVLAHLEDPGFYIQLPPDWDRPA